MSTTTWEQSLKMEQWMSKQEVNLMFIKMASTPVLVK